MWLEGETAVGAQSEIFVLGRMRLPGETLWWLPPPPPPPPTPWPQLSEDEKWERLTADYHQELGP